MSDVYRSYTRSERRTRALLVLRGAKQAIADAVDPKLERRIDAIDARAEERGAREARALVQQDEQAQNTLAAARAAERVARRGPERAAAKAARQDAQQRAARTAAALRSAGLH